RERPIVIIADPGRERESAVRLGRIGFDHVGGFLKDRFSSLESSAHTTAVAERVSAPLAAERLGTGDAVAIDVRAPSEVQQKHIPGSISVPLNHLAERLRELPKDRPLLVYCAGGYRSAIAASMLQAAGF